MTIQFICGHCGDLFAPGATVKHPHFIHGAWIPADGNYYVQIDMPSYGSVNYSQDVLYKK